MSNQARNNILSKIKQALVKQVPVPFSQINMEQSVFAAQKDEAAIEFAQNFTGLLGNFAYCENEAELALQLNHLIKIKNLTNIYCREPDLKYTLNKNGYKNFDAFDVKNCDAAITTCEYLIARTGSIILSSGGQGSRQVSVYAPIHICIAYTSQLVYNINDGIKLMEKKYRNEGLPSMVTVATGPSRTADIEKTLVVGVHGPKEVYLFLVEDVK